MTDLDESDSTASTVLDGAGELLAAVGSHLGYSSWVEVGADRVARFLQATAGEPGTHEADQVPEHLILALSNYFLPRIVEVRGFAMGVNYGTEAVRFPTPLASGGEVRAGVELAAATGVAGGMQTTMVVTIEDRDQTPVCVVHALSRYHS